MSIVLLANVAADPVSHTESAGVVAWLFTYGLTHIVTELISLQIGVLIWTASVLVVGVVVGVGGRMLYRRMTNG
jgi:hypothetical protein